MPLRPGFLPVRNFYLARLGVVFCCNSANALARVGGDTPSSNTSASRRQPLRQQVAPSGSRPKKYADLVRALIHEGHPVQQVLCRGLGQVCDVGHATEYVCQVAVVVDSSRSPNHVQ